MPISSPKNKNTSENTDSSESPKPKRGNLSIKTVALPKCAKQWSFKCPSCDHIAWGEKDRNVHHKTTHGALKCAVCDASFDTPSGLQCHKYKHSDLKYICETCGEKFPFCSQLKDHRTKHLTGRGFTCFSKNFGKSFKNNSSLICHLQVHSGKTFHCPVDGCDYSNKAERNLKSHMALHSDTHNYSW